MYLLSVLVLSIFSLWLLNRIRNRKVFEQIKNFEPFTKTTLPLIGDIHFAFGRSPNKIANYILFEVLNKPCKSVKLWLCWKLVICIATPEDLKTVTCEVLTKGSAHQVFDGYEGSILHSEPTKWKQHRRLLNSSLNSQMIKSSFSSFDAVGDALISDLMARCGQEEFDIQPIIGKHLADLTMRTHIGGGNLTLNVAKRCFHRLEAIMMKLGERLILYLVLSFGFTKIIKFLKLIDTSCNKKEYLQLLKEMEPLIETTKLDYLQEVEKNDGRLETEESIRLQPDNFLKRLLRIIRNGYMDENELIDQLCVFLIAADTPTNAISICILCLAMFPEMQEKLYRELEMVSEFTYDNIVTDFPFMDRFIKECLRLFPPGPLITRQATKDIQLEHGIIPAGTDILISILSLHRNKNFWGPDAETFNPDNFLPENIKQRHPCCYVPFSYGPRNCIGIKFAQFTDKIMLAKLVKTFKFSTKLKMADLEMRFKVTAILVNGHMVTIEKRN